MKREIYLQLKRQQKRARQEIRKADSFKNFLGSLIGREQAIKEIKKYEKSI